MSHFPRTARLLKPDEFALARKRGTRLSGASFVVYALGREEGSGTRLGLSVSARAGNAVRRNRLKRLLREYFRLNRDKLPTDTDVLVVVKEGAKADSLADVEGEFSKLLAARAAKKIAEEQRT